MLVLSFQAGAINSIAFLGCRQFVSHLTGFATTLGENLILLHKKEAAIAAILPLMFLLGAMISTYIVEIKSPDRVPRYDLLNGIIFACLTFAWLLAKEGQMGASGNILTWQLNALLLSTLAFACGIQNAIFSVRRGVVLRTTHLTGTVTDLAAELVRVIFAQDGLRDDTIALRLVLIRIGSIFAFICGAASAAYATAHIGYQAFLLPLCSSLLVWVVTMILIRSKAQS